MLLQGQNIYAWTHSKEAQARWVRQLAEVFRRARRAPRRDWARKGGPVTVARTDHFIVGPSPQNDFRGREGVDGGRCLNAGRRIHGEAKAGTRCRLEIQPTNSFHA